MDLGYTEVIAILYEVAYLRMIVPRWFENYWSNGGKLDIIKIERLVPCRTSSGGLHGNMGYAIFLLASLLFIYYILLILSHLSHRMSPPHCRAKALAVLHFGDIILIRNRCRGDWGKRERGGRKIKETERWQHNISDMRISVKTRQAANYSYSSSPCAQSLYSSARAQLHPGLHHTFF